MIGSPVSAQNYAGAGTPSVVTVAGIDFAVNNSLTSDNDGDFFALETGDSGYDEFLGDLDFTPSGETSVTIPLSVDSGTSYRIQVWYADDGGFALSPQRTMTLTGSRDNVLNGNDYAIGTFTADSTSQDLIITSSRQGVRLTGYQLREIFVPPTGPVTVADAAADYTGPSAEPEGWDYLYSTAATIGTEMAMTANTVVAAGAGNTGFTGSNSSAILGSHTSAQYEIFNDGFDGSGTATTQSATGNEGIVGTDLLLAPGSTTADAFVITRYTISTADILNGTTATIAGSFRNLVVRNTPNAASQGSVDVYVYHNTTPLFSVDQADPAAVPCKLEQSLGTFNITGLTVAASDTISFVVGNNGNNARDETALQASITLEPASAVAAHDDFFNVLTGSATDLDVLANDDGLSGDVNLASLRITSAPASGTATVRPDDTIQYVHTGTAGTDRFEYAFDNMAGTTTYTGGVDILANNGQKSANSTLAFTDQPPSGGFQFVNAFPGLTFSQGTCLETIPGNSQALVIAERAGRLQLIQDVTATSPAKTLFLDISGSTKTSTYCGLRGVAFHPDFATNRYFYVGYDHDNGSNDTVRVSRFTANGSDLNTVSAATELVLFEDSSNQAIHRINRLQFGPDGYLYIAVGDDGNTNGPGHSQHINDGFWSSVLRVDVDKKAGNIEPNSYVGIPTDLGVARFSIPKDNPFVPTSLGGTWDGTYNGSVVTGTVRSEMYATGFRNPWKIGFVPGTGELWVADDGHTGYERYYIMPKGGNAGWGWFEGTDPGTLQVGDPGNKYTGPFSAPPAGASFIQPVMEYKKPGSTATGGVKSIIGGTFYQGTDIAEMTGAYVFADSTNGDIWYMKRPNHGAYQSMGRVAVGSDWGMDETGMVSQTISESGGFVAKSYGVSAIVHLGTEKDITAMTPDPSDGSILMMDYGDSIIRRLVFNADDGSLPATLTDTGAFSDLATLTPNPGVHPYDLNLRFWSDHADKTRFFAVNDLLDTITYSEDGFWKAPAGAVWIKHFDMDLNRDNPGTNVKRLETRFLVKTADDFYGVSYRWNAAGTEADLVGSDGENFDLTITEGGTTHTQSWRIPSRGECRACHTNNNEVMLGFNTRQLNRPGTLSGTSDNFLKLLNEAGYLSSTEPLPANYASLPKYRTPDDSSVNLEERVRSYLAVNCSYCHYEGNSAVPDSWSGEPSLTIEQTNLLHGMGIGFAVADPTDRLVIPGNSAKSMVLSLASESNGYSRMPPLATDVIDQEGVALITDWINNFANAKPTLDAVAGPYSVLENRSVGTSVGTGPTATDPDAPDVSRGILTYSIEAGNNDGYFAIDPLTGEVTMNQFGPDFEVAGSYDLTVKITDAFVPNPGELVTNLTVNVTDIPNDDSQGDGIADEWAKEWFGVSAINPLADHDLDGTQEILEYWADSDPTDSHSRGLTVAPTGIDNTPGSEGFHFEWIILSSLTIGTDYIIQGGEGLDFTDLSSGSDFQVISTTAVSNPGGVALSRIHVKVPSTAGRYFLRLRNP